MADMTEVQLERLRTLTEPHPNKSKHQREMDELVLMALTRIGTLQQLSSAKGETITAMIDDRAELHARMAEHDGIYDVGALEGDRNALRDRVKVLTKQLALAWANTPEVPQARVAERESSIDWRPEAREVSFSDYDCDSQRQVIFSLPPRRCKLVVNWRSDCTTKGQVCWRIEDVADRHFRYDINSVPNPELSGISTFEHVFNAGDAGVNVELTRRGDSAYDTMIGDAVVVAFSVVELEER